MTTTDSYRRRSGQPLILSKKLGAGGEATVYAVDGASDVVAKLYHAPTTVRAKKLEAMVISPPTDPTRDQGHISLAWPTDLVFRTDGTVVGFLMPRIDATAAVPLLRLSNPQDRLQKAPGFTWKYLLRTAQNLASTLEALHAKGYVVGDLNESNILVSETALVTFIDCDSIQVSTGGSIFRCPVGKLEYTPPELQGVDFDTVDRMPEHDAFGLGVIVFLLLMGGVHPFQGVWRGPGAPPTIGENIKHGYCPCVPQEKHVISLPPFTVPFDILPPFIRQLFVRCFGDGHHDPRSRPTPGEWRKALARMEQQLRPCDKNSQHVYSSHLRRCPWCALVQRGYPDVFPKLGQQQPLPRVSFAPLPSANPPVTTVVPVSLPQSPTNRLVSAVTPIPPFNPPSRQTTPLRQPYGPTVARKSRQQGKYDARGCIYTSFCGSILLVFLVILGIIMLLVSALGSACQWLSDEWERSQPSISVSQTSSIPVTPVVTTFIVNFMPVGCHERPVATAPVMREYSPGVVQGVEDGTTVVNNEEWVREARLLCWIRIQPGPVMVFHDLAEAEAYAATIDAQQGRIIFDLSGSGGLKTDNFTATGNVKLCLSVSGASGGGGTASADIYQLDGRFVRSASVSPPQSLCRTVTLPRGGESYYVEVIVVNGIAGRITWHMTLERQP